MNFKLFIDMVCITFASLTFIGTANASLIGDTIHYDRIWGTTYYESQDSVVGSGFEIEIGNAFSDIGADSIRVEFQGFGFSLGDPGHILKWSSLDWVGEPNRVISGVDVIFGGGITSFDAPEPFSASNITFGDHFISMEVGGYTFDTDAFVEININTSIVPVPAALWLFSSGVISLLSVARIKNNSCKKSN